MKTELYKKNWFVFSQSDTWLRISYVKFVLLCENAKPRRAVFYAH